MGAKTRRERARGLLTHLAALIARGRVKELLAPFSARDSNRPVIEQFLRRILAAGVESIAFDLIDLQDEEASRFTVVAGCRFTLRGYGPHWYLWSFTLDDGDHAVHKARFSMACDPRDLRPDFVPADLGWDAGAETRAAWASRHQEAAAAAQDPHSVVEYARASEKRLRFLLTNPRLVPAVIIANMMSSRVARVAAQIYDPRPEPMLKSLFNYHAHQITHLEDHPDPETATVSFNGATYPTFDEMAGYFPRDGHAFGLCGSLALFNFAALRLAGVPADELLLVGLRSPYAMHELVLWRRAKARREESYVFDNSFWQRWNPQRFYEMTEVYRWCNDRAWGAESGTNLDARGVVSLCERFGGAFPQFRLPAVPAAQPARLSQPAPATAGLDIAGLDTAGLDIAAVPDPDQLAARMKERVFRLSATCPDSLYTYAKYAYQTLMVSRPEAYALRSLECPVARRALAGLPTPEAARDWLRAEAVHASIFFEADRLMTADQVVLYRAADDKSRALFLWAWFALHGRDAVWLMTDQAAYVLVDGAGGGRGARQCWHGGTLQPVPHWAGEPILAMNERAAYYPAFGRNDLAGDPG